MAPTCYVPKSSNAQRNSTPDGVDATKKIVGRGLTLTPSPAADDLPNANYEAQRSHAITQRNKTKVYESNTMLEAYVAYELT